MSCDECYYLFIDFFKQFFKEFDEYKHYYNYHYTPLWPQRDSPTVEWIKLENMDASTQTIYDNNDNELIEQQPIIPSPTLETRASSTSSYGDWIPIDNLFKTTTSNNDSLNKID